MRCKFPLLLILIVLILQCIQPTLAQANPSITSQPVFKQNTEVTIPLPCTINGDYCSSNSTCKTTIINPDGITLMNNYDMTKNDAVFEVNLTANQTLQNGEYQFNVVCSDNGDSVSRFLKFYVTPNGEMPTTASGILYIGLLVLVLIFFGIVIYSFIVSSGLVVKFTLFHIGYLLFISLLFIAWNMSANYFMSVTFLVSFFRIVWWVFFVGYFPLLLGSFIWIGYMMITINEIKGMMDRGISEDEAWGRKRGKRW